MSKELDARLAALIERCDETDKLIIAARRFVDLEDENAKLRELVRDMWRDGMCECDERGACAECEYHFPDRMRELGVEEPSRWATCECGEDVEMFEGCHEAVCPSCGRVVRG